jgi:hypothetical protein
MGEATKPPQDEKFEGPLIAYGDPIVITSTALVVDRKGVGWWIVIEAGERSIIRAFG